MTCSMLHAPYIPYPYNMSNMFPVYFGPQWILLLGGNGRRATCMTIATAVFIWILALICGIPALIGSNVKVSIYVFSSIFPIYDYYVFHLFYLMHKHVLCITIIIYKLNIIISLSVCQMTITFTHTHTTIYLLSK